MNDHNIDFISIGKITDFDEIESNPETSNFWMITPDIALWFSSYDNKWRFMHLIPGNPTRRSGESFETKAAAKEFLQSGKVPTWVKGSIVEEKT